MNENGNAITITYKHTDDSDIVKYFMQAHKYIQSTISHRIRIHVLIKIQGDTYKCYSHLCVTEQLVQ